VFGVAAVASYEVFADDLAADRVLYVRDPRTVLPSVSCEHREFARI
jgi:hypothetical protein